MEMKDRSIQSWDPGERPRPVYGRWGPILLVLIAMIIAGLWVGGHYDWGRRQRSFWSNGTRTIRTYDFEQDTTGPYETNGPAHCGWESIRFLSYRRGAYANSSVNVPGYESYVYNENARLPPDAQYTGWHQGSRQLWVSPSEVDRPPAEYSGIYIVLPDHTERWPIWRVGCA